MKDQLDELRYPKQSCEFCLVHVGCQFVSALIAAQKLGPEAVDSVLKNHQFSSSCANYTAIRSLYQPLSG